MKSIAIALCSLALAGCSGSSDAEHLGRSAAPIVNGTPSDDSQNAVVRLVIVDPTKPNTAGICTGTLIASDMVLTARHCVSHAEESVTCLVVDGALVGGAITDDRDPTNIQVVVGTNPATGQTDAIGAKIFHDSGTNLCGHDFAVLLLDRRLGGPIAPVRIDNALTQNERFTAVGWGTNGSAFATVRQQRANVEVENIGPTTIDLTTGHRVAIGSNELLVGESDCSGDSGSPALDPTSGAVIAVASRSGIGAPDTKAPCNSSKNVYTSLAGFKDVITTAFSGSGETVWIEGQPAPPRPPPTPDPSSSKSGCTISHAGERATQTPWMLAVLLALALALRGLVPRNARRVGSSR